MRVCVLEGVWTACSADSQLHSVVRGAAVGHVRVMLEGKGLGNVKKEAEERMCLCRLEQQFRVKKGRHGRLVIP